VLNNFIPPFAIRLLLNWMSIEQQSVGPENHPAVPPVGSGRNPGRNFQREKRNNKTNGSIQYA